MTALHAISAPHPASNAEAEGMLCASLMYDNRSIDGVADVLAPEDFSDPFFGHVFSLIVRERSLGHSANPVTLKPHFDDTGYRVLCGLFGASGLGAVSPKDFAEQIRSLARRRRLADGLQAVLADVRAMERPLADLVSDTEAAIADAADDDDGVREISASAAAFEAIADLDRQVLGVASGIDPIDEALGQLEPEDQVIVAGRPGMGKTAVALSYGLGAARKGHGVLYVSLEMSAKQLAKRLLADMCFNGRGGIPYSQITNKTVNADQKRVLSRAADELADLPLQIVDAPALTASSLNRTVKRWKRRFAAKGQKLELVIIDYLQLVRSDQREKDIYTRVSEVSKALKAGAKANEVAYMTLAQLSRDVEKRGGDHRPNASDLRDSGQIEQDADVIMFLLRPEFYLMRDEPSPDKGEQAHLDWQAKVAAVLNVIEFICAKHRRSCEGVTSGHFYRVYQAVRG